MDTSVIDPDTITTATDYDDDDDDDDDNSVFNLFYNCDI